MGGALGALIAFCLVALFVIWFQSRRLAIQPTTTAKIPKLANWHGGRDGGSWVELVDSREDETFRLRIYRDGTGDLEVDSWFSLSENCRGQKVSAVRFHDLVQGYDGKQLAVTPPDGRQHCFLRKIASESKAPAVYYRINRQRVPREEFERLKGGLEISKVFTEGEMTRPDPAGGKRRDHGFIHIWEASDRKTKKRYQYSIQAFEDETTYSIQAVRK